jgi:soluble lytic murein transglycosylase-like protein
MEQVLSMVGGLYPLSATRNQGAASEANLTASQVKLAGNDTAQANHPQVDAAFLRQLTEALQRQWVLSVFESLPLPGADTPPPSPFGAAATGLVGPSANDFLTTWMSLVANAEEAVPDTNGSHETTASASPEPSGNPSADAIHAAVRTAAMRYNVPEALIYSVMQQESGMNPRALSAAGAIGLMQLMPETARALGVDPWDPVQNIDGGTRYLAQLLKQFDGDVRLALAAYNAGPEAVRRYGGIPPYPETQSYVESILARLEEPGS